MRKIFILGGSDLQLDLILEAKKMFFYTIVLDMNAECIGAKWCDEFLPINIADKEKVLQKAKEYKIDMILTSATELGNITACWVGERLKLNTNSYQTALNTTNKVLMKKIMTKYNILTAKYEIVYDNNFNWNSFPCIVKPSDSSAARGVSYCQNREEIKQAIKEVAQYSNDSKILIEEYIDGVQYSVETISCNSEHQIIAINNEFIHDLPNILEISHTIPAQIDEKTKGLIKDIIPMILDVFSIKYGAGHIEIRVTEDNNIYLIELASRTGGWRTEMINLAYGINYSQLLLLASLNNLSKVRYSRYSKVICNFIIDYKSYEKYLSFKEDSNFIIFEPMEIKNVSKDFEAQNTIQVKGYYYILELLK